MEIVLKIGRVEGRENNRFERVREFRIRSSKPKRSPKLLRVNEAIGDTELARA